MSLTVGTDSYITLAECDAYHTAIGNAGWAGEDTVKEIAIRKATAYIDRHYRSRWKGIRSYQNQALAWPRFNVLDEDGYLVDPDTVPQRIKDAVCEAALRLLTEDMDPDVERGNLIQSQSVGSISVTYMPGAPGGKRYATIDGLLSGLTRGFGGVEIFRS